jgi:hypothetical protein
MLEILAASCLGATLLGPSVKRMRWRVRRLSMASIVQFECNPLAGLSDSLHDPILARDTPILTTDGIHIDRPPTPAEREALLAYLRRL